MMEIPFTTLRPSIPKPGGESSMEALMQQFGCHARELADAKFPWLFPLLQSCNALVYVAPGNFLFALQSNPSVWHSIPEIGNHIAELPWVVDLTKFH